MIMKKITFLIAHLGGGGAERITTIIANQMAENGTDVEMIVFSKKYNEYEVSDKIRLSYLPEKKNKFLDIVAKIIELKKLLKIQNPDYVCSLGFSYKYLFAANLMRKYNFILSERNAPQYQNVGIERYIVRYCLERAQHIVFQTEDAQKQFSPLIQQKSIIIPNPIKGNLPEPYEGERRKVISAFSRLNKQKNFSMMLRAFKIFLDEYPDYSLEIYGRGECEKEILDLAKKMDIIDRVKLMGFSKNVHEDIKSSTIYISTSDYEGISNSMLEAMAIGLPVVCTDCPVGGARMVIEDGINGFLVPVGNAEAAAMKMKLIASDKHLQDVLSRNAKKIKDRFSIKEITKMWEELMK